MSLQEVIDNREEENEDDDSFSNSPEGSSDDEDVDDEKIDALRKQLETNPYTYDLHVQLITLYRKLGDLDELRRTRESMSKLFPLTPELWLDWLTDEEKLASNPEEKKSVVDLFERAIKDYMSVSVWLEYVQFSIGNLSDGADKVREIFERALTAVGLHVTQGSLIWEAYREFEKALLLALHQSEPGNEEEIEQQESRVLSLFRRQLSVPLQYMDKTYRELKEYLQDKKLEDKYEYSFTESLYQRSMSKYEKLKPYEDALFNSEPPHTSEYLNYIDFALKEGDPIRVQNTYERALLENCLKPEIWDQYTKYLDRKVKIGSISLPVHERAVRNCPWCINLWINYGRALERHEQPHSTVVEIFETALQAGIAKAEDFKELWLAYLDYIRRGIKPDADNAAEIEEISAVFERASEQMATYFKGSESEYCLIKYQAFFEVKYKKNIKHARELWDEVLTHEHSRDTHVWLEYASFERLYGDDEHYKKVLLKALYAASEWQESIVSLLITYEREEGTLESLDAMIEKCELHMKIINEKRLKAAQKAEEVEKKDDKRLGRHRNLRQYRLPFLQNSKLESLNRERDSDVPVKMDSEGFKIPPPPSSMHGSPDGKSELPKASPSGSGQQKREAPSEDLPNPKKQRTESEAPHGMSVEHDPTKDDRTVFLSNLSYDLEETQIQEFFASVGEIEEIRLVRDFKGRSKGYCYVVYSSQKDAKTALEKDRAVLGGRPVYVSPSENKKSNPSGQSKFKFGTGLEKNKLFIKGLPFSTTKEELTDIFKEFGALKDVRLVTYRNGHSKGLAYVEFEDEAAAAVAIVKADGSSVGSHVISVSISNPPSRKPKKEFSGVSVSQSLGGRTSNFGPRGKGRTQVSLVPRSVARPQSSKRPPIQNGQNNDTTPSEGKLSNSDFRDMLLNK